MTRSIYDQLGDALRQTARDGQRSILFRGAIIPCVVLQGVTETKLSQGGLQEDATVHVKINRELVPQQGEGDPHTNETATYPAAPVKVAGGALLNPQQYVIGQIVTDEFSFSLTLVDPSK